MKTIEKTMYGDIEVHLSFLDEQEFTNLDVNKINISSCFCFPIKNDKILLTKNPRGWDIIGGHVEKKERPEETMTRESLEEGGIEVIDFRFLGAIRVFNPNWNINSKYPEVSYQLFYKSDKFKIKEFQNNYECSERKFFNIDEIKDVHHKWLKTHNLILKQIK